MIVPAGVAFEVTPFAFRMAAAGPFGVRRSAWPRSAVVDVRTNRLENKLVLKITGQDPLAVTVAPSLAGTEAVMHELIASLTVIPTAPPGDQLAPPAGTPGLPPRSSTRATLVWVAIGLILFAAFAMPFNPPVGCAMVVAAAASAGIAVGTRDKDLWV